MIIDYAMFEKRIWGQCTTHNDCIHYTGCIGNHGYGVVSWHGKPSTTHRISYAHAFSDPGKKYVLHKCDDRRCIKPSHLYCGTQKENIRDVYLRGRFGSNAKLSEEKIKGILNLYLLGKSHTEIGEKYGISRGHVSRIISCGSWGHMHWETPEKRRYSHLFPEDILKIRKLKSAGFRACDIAKWFGVSRQTIGNILHKRSWKDINDLPTVGVVNAD